MRHIFSTEHFFRLVSQERFRCDRNGQEFAILSFYPLSSRRPKRELGKAVPLIAERMRSCDDIGWVDKKQLGILLPYTSKEEAHRIAVILMKRLQSKKISVGSHIFAYPQDWLQGARQEQRGWPGVERLLSGSRSTNPYPGVSAPLANEIFPNGSPPLKRVVDVFLALCLTVLLCPLMILIAVYIKSVSSGPVLFCQQRVGFRGKLFSCLKFRTMSSGSSQNTHADHLRQLSQSDSPLEKLDQEDGRLIPGGSVLRAAGLDELPQLFNVILGDMSLIGPRPCIPYEREMYRHWHHRRFDGLPGLSGLWQTSGKNQTSFTEMMRLDIAYVQRRSIGLDVKILMKTPMVILEQLSHLANRDQQTAKR